MNACPLLLRRTSSTAASFSSLCRACRSGATASGLRRRQFSSTSQASFQAYTLPTRTPPTPPRAADAAHPVDATTPLPQVHETRPAAAAAAGAEKEQQLARSPTPPSSSNSRDPRSTTVSDDNDAKPQKQQQSSAEATTASSSPSTPSSTSSPPAPKPSTSTTSSSTPKTPTQTQKRPSRLRAPRKAAIRLTPRAVSKLRTLLDGPTPKLIKVGVRNRGCSGLQYHFEEVDKPSPFDERVEQDGVSVLIDSKALFSIIGSEMDWVESRLSERFTFDNPNIKEECGCGESFNV